MFKFDVGLVTITSAGRKATYTEVRRGEDFPTDAPASLAEISTTDGLRGTVGVIEWPDTSGEIKLVDFAEGPDMYRRLDGAGKTQIISQDSTWLMLVRALKWGARPYPTLHNVTFSELDKLIKDDSRALLSSFPNVEIGRYGDMQPKATPQHRDGIGLRVPAGEMDALAAAYAMTRVVPIMMGFGLQNVIGVD
jgi:hypothetical protein